MPAQILSGKEVADRILADVAKEVDSLARSGCRPFLAVVRVGDDPASVAYVRGKRKDAARVGILSEEHTFPEETGQEDVCALIDRLNREEGVHGVLVQLPLPPHIDEEAIIERIAPEKDVDGFHPVNVGRMVLGQETFLPCTPHGILMMLRHAGVEVRGRHVVVVGRSNIVGKPLANLLLQKREGGNATVTVCHTATPDIGSFTRQADIVVVAAGRPGVLTGEMVNQGAVVIDVGINRVEDPSSPKGYRLVGDVDFESVAEKASLITPVPGGVGLVTRAMLLWNTVRAARLAQERRGG